MASANVRRVTPHSGTFQFLLALFCLLFAAQAAQAAKLFPLNSFSYYITDYENDLKGVAKLVNKPMADLATELAAADAANNPRLSAVTLEKMITLQPKDAALWLKLAERLAVAQPINDEDKYRLPSKVIGASLKAYQLVTTREDEAKALSLAAGGFASREDWRPALQAYKESLRLVENPDIRTTYEQMREDHGFRVTDYTVENDATPPRACFTLSDPLSRTVTDFSPYFKQDPGPVSAVTADGSKLCVEGLKHGGNYTITVRKGLPSAVDEDLAKDYDFSFYVRDRAAGVRFAGKAYVLPRTGQSGMPVLTVNTKGVKLALYRIGDRGLVNSVLDSNFLSQIDGYAANAIEDEKGAKVWEGTLDTPSPLNEEVTTGFPVDAALGKLDPGLYVMTARAASQPEGETYENVATQWFVISDLGLTTMDGKDGLHAFVRSIASADPLKDVELRLVAHNNEILGTATTDESGAALFAPGLVKGTGGLAPALLVASTKDGDYDFIDITQPAFDLTDRGVAGRDPPGAIDAFVYAERGVYRRGETVHSAVLLRDGKANAITGLPITLIIERPDGVEYSRTQLADQGAGGRSYDFTINAAAQGGTWSIKAYTDPKSDPVGQTSFLVEDYVPDRIEFDLKTQATVITTGTGAPFTVDGRYLFGAPGAGLDLEGDISVTANDAPFPKWKDYSFGLTDERVDAVQNTITPLPQTDINGHADLVVRLPELPSTTRPLKADISIRMREPGGRAVENDTTLPVEATQAMFGIKTDFNADYAPQGQSSGFDIVALDPKGNPVAVKNAAWTLKKLSYDYQWFNVDGSWRYEEVTRSSKLAGGTLDLDGKAPAHLTRTLDWGLYRLEIGADGMTPASIDFSAGYYWSDTSKSDTPDTLSVALDKTTASTGDTLNVKIDSKNAGKASIQIVGDRLLAMQMVDVPAGGISVPVTIGKDWGAGAYAVATLYRPMDVKAKRMPARAIGVAWFDIDRAARTLDVKLAPTGLMKPRQNLDVPVKISNLTPGEEAYVTVAAVDVGILNLTRYKAPAPESYYYDQTRLTAEFRDLYGSLIDGMQGAAGAIRSGGDAGAAFSSPPPTQPPLALFSGLVKVKDDGTADVTFAIPGFNGTVRVMAVAWTPSKVGHAQADVIVRDPIVVAGTLPRFMAAGDQSRLRLDIINTEAPAGDYTVGVTVDGPVTGDAAKLTQKVTIGAAGARVAAFVPITATAPGDSHITARLVGPDIVIEQDYTLHVVPANPLVTRRTTMDLAANGGSITLSPDLISEMLPGTSAVSLSVSTIPELDAAGLIRDLDRYPYGCSEQTVSRALPLLYLSDLKAGKDFADDELKRRLADSVARLLNRQSANGSFGLWSAGDGDADLWLSSFVTDFLLRAREKGFDVPENNLTDAINYLRNSVGNAPDIEDGKGEDMAYALYVLARAGRAPVGDLKYLADTKLESFGTVMGRAQIGAALAILGDRQRAETAFSSAADELSDNEDNPSTEYREDYGSNLRDASALLALGIDGKASDKVIRVAAKAISTERTRTHYASTQEMSWMVLAARAIENDAKTIRLDVNGAPQQGALYKLFGEGDFTGNFRVANKGPSALRAVVAVSGSPKVADPAASNGLKVTRAYFTPDGKPVDPASVPQNTRLVAVITVDSGGNGSMDGRFLVSDRLPAGFEIENPSLVASGSTASLGWLETSGSPTYTEFRDDRFTAAFGSTPLKVAYMVRAVSPGAYAHPGVTVEDMYRPEINASTGTSTVVVTEP